jgi:gliding motility-associated-like protein
MRKVLLSYIITIFTCSLHGQVTYFNSQNQIFRLDGNAGTCNPVAIPNGCGVETNLLSIALFKDTMYYNTFGDQLKRFKLGAPGSCEILLTNNGAFNSLTVDKNGMLYMASNSLYRYDPYARILTNLGRIPFNSGGDLIFFNGELLLAGFDPVTLVNGIFKLDIDNPGNSTLYMTTSRFIGLISYPVPCANSRYFGLSALGARTDFIEIDLANKREIGVACTINMEILDAASTTETGVNDDVHINSLQITAPCAPGGMGSVKVTAEYATPGPITYILDNGTTNTTGIFPSLTAGNHTIRAIAPNGQCRKDTSFTIVAGIHLITGIETVRPDRCQVNSGSITITSSQVNRPHTYTLVNTGLTQQAGNFINLQPGTYNFRIVDAAGCTKDTSVQLTLSPEPFIKSLEVTNARCSEDNGEIKITLGVDAGTAVSSINNGPFTSALQYTGLKAGSYYLQVKKDPDCYFDTTVAIIDLPFEPSCIDIYVPTAFTPNNDGKNDVFMPWDLSFVTDITLRIYNRWGQLVYEGRGRGVRWDGSLKSIKQHSGVYIYSLNYTTLSGTKKFKKGSVTLIR